ncbi:unnamed protein product [Peniophora sp. CBMAI 1063]|nr:unnamed protein product [Peniophora sp. CBMAI 1063]
MNTYYALTTSKRTGETKQANYGWRWTYGPANNTCMSMLVARFSVEARGTGLQRPAVFRQIRRVAADLCQLAMRSVSTPSFAVRYHDPACT